MDDFLRSDIHNPLCATDCDTRRRCKVLSSQGVFPTRAETHALGQVRLSYSINRRKRDRLKAIGRKDVAKRYEILFHGDLVQQFRCSQLYNAFFP